MHSGCRCRFIVCFYLVKDCCTIFKKKDSLNAVWAWMSTGGVYWAQDHELMKLCRLAVSLQAVNRSCRLPTLTKNSAGVCAVLLLGIGSCLSRGVWQMPRMCLHVWVGDSGHWWMSGGNPSPLCPVSPSACLGILCRQALETDLCVPDLLRSCYTMLLNTEATSLKHRCTDKQWPLTPVLPSVNV